MESRTHEGRMGRLGQGTIVIDDGDHGRDSVQSTASLDVNGVRDTVNSDKCYSQRRENAINGVNFYIFLPIYMT